MRINHAFFPVPYFETQPNFWVHRAQWQVDWLFSSAEMGGRDDFAVTDFSNFDPGLHQVQRT